MLSRHYLRIKTLQSLYSFFIGGETDLKKGRKELFNAIDGIEDLRYYQLSALLELRDFAENKLEENKKKLRPTENDLNPNRRFIENPLLDIIRNDDALQRQINALRINWSEFTDHFRKIYFNVIEWKEYQKYLDLKTASFSDHKNFIAKLFKKHISFDHELRIYYEEKNIHWGEDSIVSGLSIHQWLKNYDQKNKKTHAFDEIIKTKIQFGDDDDREFVKTLFEKTILRSNEYENMIQDKISNWEIDRINQIDMLILKMALCEIEEFENIPVKVSMNEYIELAKEYGTPKSNTFVNGVLDKLVEELNKQGKFKKSGRGLKNT